MLASLLILTLAAPADIDDLVPGKTCLLKDELSFQVRGTEIETVIEAGKIVRISKVGETVCHVVEAGQVGLVSTLELVEACAPNHARCWATQAFRVKGDAIDGKRKVYRVKPDTEVKILSKKPKIVRVLIGGIEADAPRDVFDASCTESKAKAGLISDSLIDAMGPLPKGVKLALLPLAHDGTVNEEALAFFEAQLNRAFAQNVSGVAVAPEGAAAYDERERRAKALLERARVFPKALGVPYAAVVHITETGPDRFTLTAALFDREGKRRAALRARPTYAPKDRWAEDVAREVVAGMNKKKKRRKKR